MAVVSAGAVGYASHRAARELPPERQPMVGLVGAFVFAAQALNFPVLPGISGHMLGGLLACLLVGPAAGIVVMAVVFIIQALLFADGGVTALGANVFNMGIGGALCGYGVYRLLRRASSARLWTLVCVFGAAWLSVMVAALCTSLELIISGIAGKAIIAPMLGVHAVIGLGEALITVAAVQLVLATRPDLLGEEPSKELVPLEKWLWGGIALCGVMALFLAPVASSAPDGLEALAERWGFAQAAVDSPFARSPLADYGLVGVRSEALATATSVLVGTLVVLAILMLVGRAFVRPRR